MNMKEKDRKVSHKIYEAWEYEREIADLNKMSEEGWQLEKGGCFHSVFRRDDQVRYIYQLDYMPKLRDKDRYLELFSEQGWEYINSTINGWHYFKKAYSEDLSEEEKVIYTDKQSLYEMQNRYVVMLRAFVVLACVMTPVYLFMGVTHQEPAIMIEALVFVIMGVFMGLGLLNVNRARKGMTKLPGIPFIVAYPIIILLLVVAIIIL